MSVEQAYEMIALLRDQPELDEGQNHALICSIHDRLAMGDVEVEREEIGQGVLVDATDSAQTHMTKMQTFFSFRLFL